MLAAPLVAEAPPAGRIPRVGFLAATTRAEFVEAFRQGLRELGYVEGQNVVVEYRFAEGQLDLVPRLAAELVALGVDVIVVPGGVAGNAAHRVSGTIPIVMVSGDPVITGLVQSLARPGGTVTGLSSLSPDLGAKRLSLLKEALPRVSRVGVMVEVDIQAHVAQWKEIAGVAPALGVTLVRLEIRQGVDVERAFQIATRERAHALLTFRGPILEAHRQRIVELATKTRLPAMFEQRDSVEAGGLMSYGPNLRELFRRAATYVDRILKGAKPADLPVEQPTKTELVINLKTAKALGLTIPPSVLARADEVIE